MTGKQEDVAALIREIRTAFNRLKSVAEALHSDLEINPSMRAVLQALVLKAPQTVPDIAKDKGVSRQHVQKIANVLLEAGLVRTQVNPDHKRSCLYYPAPDGERLFAEIQVREAAPMDALADALPGKDVAIAGRLMACLNETLETMTNTGE
jgi:DNA-binding MarR family transcriptional regulator